MAQDGAALRAVIYIPVPIGPAAWIWLQICTDYCLAHEYEIVAVVVGGPWEDAVTTVIGGTADLVVIGRWDDAPSGMPRVESATLDDSPVRP